VYVCVRVRVSTCIINQPLPPPRAMAQFNNLSPIEAVFMAYPRLSTFACLVDVGGGLGAFVGAAMARYPRLRGELFDLPSVIKQAQRAWGEDPVRRRMVAGGRVAFRGGSFFEAGGVPRAVGDSQVCVCVRARARVCVCMCARVCDHRWGRWVFGWLGGLRGGCVQ